MRELVVSRVGWVVRRRGREGWKAASASGTAAGGDGKETTSWPLEAACIGWKASSSVELRVSCLGVEGLVAGRREKNARRRVSLEGDSYAAVHCARHREHRLYAYSGKWKLPWTKGKIRAVKGNQDKSAACLLRTQTYACLMP